MEDYVIWIITIIIFAIVEGVTMGLVSLWFIPAALIALALALLGVPMWIQIVVFLSVALLSILFLYPIAKKRFKIGHTKTNYESAIGKVGKVTLAIDNMKAEGQVKLDGQIWSAKALENDTRFEVGDYVDVVEVKGVKLIVIAHKEV